MVPTRAPAAVGATRGRLARLPAFRAEVNALGKRLEDGQGEADVRHLKKMLAWSNACALVGVATMWMSGPLARLLPIVALSTWTCTRWTMIGHHICHGGYNRQDDRRVGGSGRFTSAGFAVGSAWRRARDWLDWMLPEAWNVEHNNLHHYRLSESGDPDLVERNLELMREFPAPRPIKYVAVAFLAAMWKWCAAPRNSAATPAQLRRISGAITLVSDAASAPTPRYYYAPNTYKQLKIQQLRKEGVEVSESFAHEPFTLPVALFGLDECRKLRTGPLDFMRRVMGPMLLLRFFALPAPLLLAGAPLYWAAVANLALADALSNIHSFIIIATNHCGKDMYKFENSVKPRSGSFYMRAITSSANFRTSNGVRPDGTARKVHGHRADLNDFFGWLNYQIEHHCWPQLSCCRTRRRRPSSARSASATACRTSEQRVHAAKPADVMVGKDAMRPFDASWEHAADRFVWDDQKTAKAAREIVSEKENSDEWAVA